MVDEGDLIGLFNQKKVESVVTFERWNRTAVMRNLGHPLMEQWCFCNLFADDNLELSLQECKKATKAAAVSLVLV